MPTPSVPVLQYQHERFMPFCDGSTLAERGLHGEIASKGEKAPIQAAQRWHVERTNSWHNNFNRLQRCYERREAVVEAFFDLADAIIAVRSLIRRAWITTAGTPDPRDVDEPPINPRDLSTWRHATQHPVPQTYASTAWIDAEPALHSPTIMREIWPAAPLAPDIRSARKGRA